MSETRRYQIVFYDAASTPPPVERGNLAGFLVTVERARAPGRLFTFHAWFLNAYALDYPDGCGAENCEEEHQGECPATGWFEDNANFEYENCYYKLLGEGDSVIEWAALPGPPR